MMLDVDIESYELIKAIKGTEVVVRVYFCWFSAVNVLIVRKTSDLK